MLTFKKWILGEWKEHERDGEGRSYYANGNLQYAGNMDLCLAVMFNNLKCARFFFLFFFQDSGNWMNQMELEFPTERTQQKNMRVRIVFFFFRNESKY